MHITKKDKKNTKKDDVEQNSEDEQTIVDLLGAMQKGPEQRSIMFVGEVSEEKAADLI